MTDVAEVENAIAEGFPFTFWVGGKPRPKGSLQAVCSRNKAHTVLIKEDIEGSKAWRQAIARHARKQLPQGWVPAETPVVVTISCFFERELGVNGKVMPTHATEYPVGARFFGDSDKLARNVNDALKDAKVIADDRYVVRCLVNKEFAGEGCPAGAQITVEMR